MPKIIVLPLAGFYPVMHDGHRADLGPLFDGPADGKFIGVNLYNRNLAMSQAFESSVEVVWPEIDTGILISDSMGYTVACAIMIATTPQTIEEPVDLVLVFGHDRQRDGERFKAALEAGRIKEIDPRVKFNSIELRIAPERSTDLSGTRIRKAINENNPEDFLLHFKKSIDGNNAKYFKMIDAFYGIKNSGEILKR